MSGITRPCHNENMHHTASPTSQLFPARHGLITTMKTLRALLLPGPVRDRTSEQGLGGRRQDAKGERSGREHQHECGRPNAFDIADTQMGHDGSHEIEDETDSRRDSA